MKFGFFAIVLVAMLANASAAAAAGLSLTPDEGTRGSSFVVTGTGFEPGRNVKLRWDGSGIPGVVTVDDSGMFSAKLTVPNDASIGTHLVSAKEGGRGQEATARFTVVAPPTTTTVATTTPPTTTPPTTTPPTTTVTPAPPTTTAPPPTPTTTAGSATSTSTPTPSTEAESITSTLPPEDPIGGGQDTNPTPAVAPAPNRGSAETSGEAAELRVSPDQATAGQGVVATLSSAGPIAGEIWLELDGRAVTQPRPASDAGTVIFRFRIPDDLVPGTYALVAVTGDGESLSELTKTGISVVEAGTGSPLLWLPLLLILVTVAALTWGWRILAARRRSRTEDELDASNTETAVQALADTPSQMALVATSGGWTRRIFDVGQSDVSVDDIAVFSDKLWAVGAGSHGPTTSAIVWSSDDGSNWDQIADLGPGKATSVDTTQGHLIITGTHPSPTKQAHWEWGVWGSADGVAWRSLLGEAGQRPRGTPLGIAGVGETLMVYGRSREHPQVWRASDFSPLEEISTPGPVDYVAHTDEGFIAFGKDDMGLPIVLASENGDHWTPMDQTAHSPLSGSSVRAFVEFGGSMIAAGFGVANDRAAVWASDDGEHWDAVPFPAETGTSITHLVALDDRLVAIGNTRQLTESRVMTSIAAWMTTDGLIWESLGDGSLLGDATPSAVSAMGDRLVIAGRMFTVHGPKDPGTPTMWSYDPNRDVPEGTSEIDLAASSPVASQPHRTQRAQADASH